MCDETVFFRELDYTLKTYKDAKGIIAANGRIYLSQVHTQALDETLANYCIRQKSLIKWSEKFH